MHKSEMRIPAAVFVEIVKKAVHGWDITITPADFTKNPELYDTVTITVSNQDMGVTRDAFFHLPYLLSPPSNYTLLINNIATLVCRDTNKKEAEVYQRISNQFTAFFNRK